MNVVVLDKEKLKKLFLTIDATIIIRKYNSSHRSKNSSVAKEEVLTQVFLDSGPWNILILLQLLRDDKSGLIMDRRKNLRSFKQAFVAVEAINLIMRKLKIDDRLVAISLLDVLRERGIARKKKKRRRRRKKERKKKRKTRNLLTLLTKIFQRCDCKRDQG